ncbi:MAG TPA: heme ABC exporter ATP-binding protein CcmA [Methanomassiliicoccales archaeon]|jgi:heme exporter protein A
MLQVKDLWKSYGRKEVLKGVSLSLESGKMMAILGPNGAGKTTLLRIIATLSSADKGQVLIDSIDIRADPVEARRAIGAVMHAPLIYDELTVIENLRFFHSMAGRPSSQFMPRAEALLEDLGLGLRKNDISATLSMGMSRRLSIARALITSPRLLLLDEPFSGLDLKSIDLLSAILQREKNDCGGGLLVTHDLELASSFADQGAVLDGGVITATFSREEMAAPDFRRSYQSSLRTVEP